MIRQITKTQLVEALKVYVEACTDKATADPTLRFSREASAVDALASLLEDMMDTKIYQLRKEINDQLPAVVRGIVADQAARTPRR